MHQPNTTDKTHAITIGYTTRRAIELDAALVRLYRQGHAWGEVCVNDAADRFRDTRMNLAALAGHDRLRRVWREEIRTLALHHLAGALTVTEIAALAANILHPGPPGQLIRPRGNQPRRIALDHTHLMTKALTMGTIIAALDATPRSPATPMTFCTRSTCRPPFTRSP